MRKNQKLPLALFRTALVGLVVAAAVLVGATTSAAAQTVTTPKGTFPAETFQGVAGTGVTEFLGIRFAAAPTGNLRFAPPVAPAAVSGTVSATSFGANCPQNASPFGVASTSEDCLFLNVYVPGSSVSAKNKLPVMVFFYGGAFVDGEGSLYDPTNLAIQGNNIVVTINYRLGILGYVADAALSAEASNGVSGNYGFEDQLFSLQWVQQNIGAFGGNPNDVTIFGESAGAFSVCAAVVSPKGTGLFQRAISESGPCGFPLPTLAGAEASGATIVSALGCAESSNAATVACLRGLSVDAILSEQTAFTAGANLSSLAAFFPNVDGDFIPQQPILALALGEYNHVPIMEGTNHDEGRLFVALGFDLNPAVGTITSADYAPAVESIVETLVTEEAGLLATTSSTASVMSSSSTAQEVTTLTNEILNEYPLSNFAGPGEALGAVLTDSIFSCTANISNELFSLEVPTFAYEFNDENAPMLFLPAVSFPYGATHTDELQFLFTFDGVTDPLSSNEETLAATMKSYWTDFAQTGNPNSSQTANWAKFDLLDDNVQSLTPPTPSVEFNYATEHHCNFWIGILEQTILSSVVSELEADGITE
jgi:para-nitrobenzyl esterase